MKKLLDWFKDNFLFIYSSFLLIFVTLYPKLPLFDLIPGYIVRVRIEDFLILFAVIILFFIHARQRFRRLRTPLDKPILIYLVIGFLSMLAALFVTKTVFLEPLHSGKMFIHWVRRIEYFSIFYIFYLSVKNRKQIRILIILFLAVLVGVDIYGFGQKYLSWPVYSTMNREFSKGWQLVLTEHARVVSTFAGHYDLAAYLVVALMLSCSLMLGLRNRVLKAATGVIFVASIYLLILTASRTSFISYIVALLTLSILWGLYKKKWSWSLSRGFIVFYLSFFIMFSFGDLNERFAQIFGVKQIWTLLGVIKEPFRVDMPQHLTLDEELSLIALKSDVPPKIVGQGETNKNQASQLPPDVLKDIPEKMETVYAMDEFGNMVATTSAVARRYSAAAFQVGLSGAIRLDALWPRAFAAFKKNPLLGTGYSTLTKESVAQFTEAESTDNDYLRALGETGLAGLVSFFGIIIYVLIRVFKEIRSLLRKNGVEEQNFRYALFVSYVAATFGLFVNALYIDVFEASKVAFVFWFFTAVVLKELELGRLEMKD